MGVLCPSIQGARHPTSAPSSRQQATSANVYADVRYIGDVITFFRYSLNKLSGGRIASSVAGKYEAIPW